MLPRQLPGMEYMYAAPGRPVHALYIHDHSDHYHHHPDDTHLVQPGNHHHRHERNPRPVNPPDFLFCVELGLVIRSRRRGHKSVSGLLDEISARLTRAGISNHVASTPTDPVFPQGWTVTGELCIPSRPRDHRFGVKLASPFMRFAWRPEAWQEELRSLFDTLNTHFELTTTHSCFTHVHLVPAAGYWRLAEARSLAKSALYFERCLDALVPPYRRRSVWAKSNRHNRYFAGLPMAECFARVDAQATFEGLAARMNWCSGNSPTGAALLRGGVGGRHDGSDVMSTHSNHSSHSNSLLGGGGDAACASDFQHDAYRWSFAHLSREGGGLGTVGFRQPPGASGADEAAAWVMLVGCLARLSCGLGDSLEPADPARLDSLGEWLLYEAEWCALPRKALLRDLVAQAVPVTGAPDVVLGLDADSITLDEDQRLRWKANDRDVVAEKYRLLMQMA